MANTEAPATLAKLSNVELNEAFGRACHPHSHQWGHPRRVALRAEMNRRAIAAGRIPGR